MAKRFKGKVPKGMTWKKARLILHEGEVRGRPLTAQQRKYFGALFTYLKPAGLSREAAKRQALKLGKKKKKAGGKKAIKKKGRKLKRKARKAAARLPKKRGLLCKVCKKPIRQRKGPGRPRLRHKNCQ